MSLDDYSDLPEDERPIDETAAKEHAKRVLGDPKHKREKGHRDVERTRDDDMSDPQHNTGEE